MNSEISLYFWCNLHLSSCNVPESVILILWRIQINCGGKHCGETHGFGLFMEMRCGVPENQSYENVWGLSWWRCHRRNVYFFMSLAAQCNVPQIMARLNKIALRYPVSSVSISNEWYLYKALLQNLYLQKIPKKVLTYYYVKWIFIPSERRFRDFISKIFS